jgi:hypothetical protein
MSERCVALSPCCKASSATRSSPSRGRAAAGQISPASDSTASVRPNHMTTLNGEFDDAITGLDRLLGNSR